jgi:hypothetical protein
LTRAFVARCADVALTSQPDPAHAITTLDHLVALAQSARTVLLPTIADRSAGGSRPQLVAALARHAALHAPPAIGVPLGTSDQVVNRWRQLADVSGATLLQLGATGWDRVVLGEHGRTLTDVLVPAELTDADRLVVFPVVTDTPGVFRFWRQIVHPHSRLRATAGRWHVTAAVDLAAPFSARYVLDLTHDREARALAGLAWTDDPVAAELVILGTRVLRDRAAGVETRGPWEDEHVQAAVESGLGIAGGHGLVLRVAVGDNRAARLADGLAELLDCRVERVALEG